MCGFRSHSGEARRLSTHLRAWRKFAHFALESGADNHADELCVSSHLYKAHWALSIDPGKAARPELAEARTLPGSVMEDCST
jgi:hypothetical protein